MVNDIITFGGGSKRQKDPNGFLHVDDCVLTKAVVNEYMGREIPKWDELGLNPDKIYRVLRDPAAIESSLEQMNGLPILDDHDERHDAETPQQHKRIGCIGTDGSFDGKEVRNRLTFWNKRDIDAIESGAKVCLSMGYDYEPVMQSGKYDGEAYDLKMADIVWNHIAHVEKGRVDGAVVADASGVAGMVRRAFDASMNHLIAKAKRQGWDSRNEDTAMSKIDRRIAPNHHATKDKKHIRAGANDSANTKGNDMHIPKSKRTGDEDPEETAENRVIAGIKALAAEFDNVHKENGIDPGITDEETDTLKKVQDFLDSFANRGKDAEMAGTTADPMDEDPESMDEFPPKKKEGGEEPDPNEAEDEEPPVHNAKGEYEDAEKGKSPTGDKAMDADAILAQVRREFRMKEQALDEVAPLVGSVQKARAMDSALDVYRFALATHGVEIPKAANLSGLRGMVNMLKRSMQPTVRTGDSFKPTGAEAKIADMIGKSPYAPRE